MKFTIKYVLLLPTLLALIAQAAETTAPIDVGSEKQLFIDNLFFESSEGIRLKVNPAVKTGEQNVTRDRPWESATLSWFSVMEDPGGTLEVDGQPRARYRMWYEAYDIDGWPNLDDTSFCYAESADGITWTKPELDLFSYQGSTKNNILFRQIGPEGARSRVHGAQVFMDPAAPADQRYKAVSQGIFEALGTPPYRVAGMYSADGLQWTRYPAPICDIFGDSQYSAVWDEETNEYVLFGRVNGRGRALGRSTSKDFSKFEPLQLVLQSDEKDPPNSGLYNPAAMKYPHAARAWFMFPSLYHLPNHALDIRIATSRDGINWTWPEQDRPFIPLGNAGEFDRGSLYMGQGLLRDGNTLYQYYGGSPLHHEEGELDALVLPGNSRTMSRVTSRLDGFVSVEAEAGGGAFVTPPLLFQGKALKLNVHVRDGGYLRVGLLDENDAPIARRIPAECEAITGDQIDALVAWKDGSDVAPRAGKPTRLRIEMDRASLYAFRFTGGDEGK
jgi:hypothetical protein